MISFMWLLPTFFWGLTAGMALLAWGTRRGWTIYQVRETVGDE